MIRLIARLDIKGPNLIKGIHLEGLRVIGDPQVYAEKYYLDGADELIYIDSVASLYGRNNLTKILSHAAQNIFIPLTAGGGIRSTDDVQTLLSSGADKIAINTAAVKNPQLITDIAKRFGSQCVVLSVEAKSRPTGGWEVYTDNGRERTGLDVIEWVRKAEKLGAGEVLITSVDREGTRKGLDIDLTGAVCEAVNIPVIASGGIGKIEHLNAAIEQGKADAVAMASVLHYNNMTIEEIRHSLIQSKVPVRPT